MKSLSRIIVIIAANALALWAAANYIDGISFKGGIYELAVAAVIFTLLNFFLKPILKLLLGPLIILTLGFALILVNAIILYVLDLFSPNLMIDGFLSLLYATVLVGVINFVFHLATKK